MEQNFGIGRITWRRAATPGEQELTLRSITTVTGVKRYKARAAAYRDHPPAQADHVAGQSSNPESGEVREGVDCGIVARTNAKSTGAISRWGSEHRTPL